MKPEQTFRVSEVAEMLKISHQTAADWVRPRHAGGLEVFGSRGVIFLSFPERPSKPGEVKRVSRKLGEWRVLESALRAFFERSAVVVPGALQEVAA